MRSLCHLFPNHPLKHNFKFPNPIICCGSQQRFGDLIYRIRALPSSYYESNGWWKSSKTHSTVNCLWARESRLIREAKIPFQCHRQWNSPPQKCSLGRVDRKFFPIRKQTSAVSIRWIAIQTSPAHVNFLLKRTNIKQTICLVALELLVW